MRAKKRFHSEWREAKLSLARNGSTHVWKQHFFSNLFRSNWSLCLAWARARAWVWSDKHCFLCCKQAIRKALSLSLVHFGENKLLLIFDSINNPTLLQFSFYGLLFSTWEREKEQSGKKTRKRKRKIRRRNWKMWIKSLLVCCFAV